MHRKGEGTGRPTASYHIDVKNRPFSAVSSITESEILSTTTLDEKPQNIFKNHTYFRKNSLQTAALFTML